MLTVLHPLVDFCSIAILAAGGLTLERWLAYNALAFALQLPLGIVRDARPGGERGALAVGCGLVAFAALATAHGAAGWWPLVAATVGNALFHLAAGATVLERSSGRCGRVGLFISTGALGLAAGQALSQRDGAGGFIAVGAAILAACAAGQVWLSGRAAARADAADASRRRGHRRPYGAAFGSWAVAGFFALVVWRGWAGLLAAGTTAEAGAGLALAGVLLTFAGKATGGYLADAVERRGVVVGVSVAGSAALWLWGSPASAATWLTLLFVAQLATGPVLSFLYDTCSRRSGTAFGLNSFGLFAGSLI